MTGWADLCLVWWCGGQGHEGAELPAVAVCAHEVLGWRGLGEVRIAVGEGCHVPAHHPRTARWLPAVVDRESAGRENRRSNRATSPRRRCGLVPLAVMRCSAVSQSKHVGPGGATMGAATTTRPQSAV